MLDATKMTEAEICEAVATRLETHGWQRFGYGSSTGPNCLMGAISNVFGEFSYSVAFTVAKKLQIPDREFRVYASITGWNDDHPANAKQEIIDQLRAA